MPLTKEQKEEIRKCIQLYLIDEIPDYVIDKLIELTEQMCEKSNSNTNLKLISTKLVLKKFQEHNGSIETIDEGFWFLDRETKCSICKRVYWDKPCPDCRRKELQRQAEEIILMIKKADMCTTRLDHTTKKDLIKNIKFKYKEVIQ